MVAKMVGDPLHEAVQCRGGAEPPSPWRPFHLAVPLSPETAQPGQLHNASAHEVNDEAAARIAAAKVAAHALARGFCISF
jgi:hypothetical protein